MTTESERLTNVFQNKYYSGMSVTNQLNGLSFDKTVYLFNKYRAVKYIMGALLMLNKCDTPNYKVLDAGCGNGNTLRNFINFFDINPANCYGVDISEDVIEFARSLTSPLVNFKVSEIINAEYDDNFFDIIVNMGVLIHILDDEYIKKVSKELRRVIKKDGILFIMVSDEKCAWSTELLKITRNFHIGMKELDKLFAKEFEVLYRVPIYTDTYSSASGSVSMADFPKIELQIENQEDMRGFFHLYALKPI